MADDVKFEHRKADEKVTAEQEKRIAQQAERDSIERAGLLTEKLIAYGQAYCKEQGLTPEECVFAASLYLVNLRETFPSGKDSFDAIASRAADYFDENS